MEHMTDKTQIIVIEHGMNVIIKEKEGLTKKGEPKQIRISNFKNPKNALTYLKEKFGLTAEETT
jgi:hypothetical protein